MAKSKNVLGGWAFLIGVVLAVVLGLLGSITNQWIIVLVILGLIVGLLNIADQEVNGFLTSGIILVIASALGQGVMGSVVILNNILQALLAIFVPAIIIVAIKHVFSLAKN